MSKTHWKKLVNPNYLGAYSIEDGKDLILTIKSVAVEEITGEKGLKDQGMVIQFKEDQKPMILNRTNAKSISKLAGSSFIEDWSGTRIQLFATTTRFGGDTVECLRIRPFAPKSDQPVALKCTDCGNEIVKSGKISAGDIADGTRRTYGRQLCYQCGVNAKDAASKPDKLSEQIGQAQPAPEGAEHGA